MAGSYRRCGEVGSRSCFGSVRAASWVAAVVGAPVAAPCLAGAEAEAAGGGWGAVESRWDLPFDRLFLQWVSIHLILSSSLPVL